MYASERRGNFCSYCGTDNDEMPCDGRFCSRKRDEQRQRQRDQDPEVDRSSYRWTSLLRPQTTSSPPPVTDTGYSHTDFNQDRGSWRRDTNSLWVQICAEVEEERERSIKMGGHWWPKKLLLIDNTNKFPYSVPAYFFGVRYKNMNYTERDGLLVWP